MIQPRRHPSFPPQAFLLVLPIRDRGVPAQHLNRHLAAQAFVSRLVDDTHATSAQLTPDPIRADPFRNHQVFILATSR